MMPEFLDKKSSLVFIIIVCFLLTGCRQADEPSSLATMVSSTPEIATAIPSPTPHLLPTPTPTYLPTPSATPGPVITLDELHPDISYTIPLTTQWVSDTSAVLHFALSRAAVGYLFYGTASEGEFSQSVPIRMDGLAHQIVITDLEVGATYQAAVGLFSEGVYRTPGLQEESWDPIHLQTLKTDPWPIRIGVIGDSGFGGRVTFNLADQMADYDLDFVIHTGDLVYKVEENDDAAEAFIAKYYRPFSTILHEIPIYPVPGNHEFDAAARWRGVPCYYAAFPQLTGGISGSGDEYRRYYALELGKVQFLFLNSQDLFQGQGISAQTLWLEERLNDDRFVISLPVLHIPPFTSGLHLNDGVFIAREWVPLFGPDHVPIVLSGHDHNYQRLFVNGITYVVSGGGSRVLYSLSDPHPGSMFFSATSHFVLLSLYQDRLELEAISVDDEVLDSVVIDLVMDLP
jgi:predicted phosphodiesterase